MCFDGPKNLMCFDGPSTSCDLMDPSGPSKHMSAELLDTKTGNQNSDQNP
jgi:hypothetical protein